MNKTILTLLFLLLLLSSRAGNELTPGQVKAYELVLQLRFDDARKLLEQETNAKEDHLVPYLEHYIQFLSIIISEDEKIFKSCSAGKETIIRQLEAGNAASPWHLYSQAMFNMQWAFARLKFGEYTTAAVEMNRAYHLLVRNRDLYPGFAPNRAALGLMKVLIGSVPDNYQWIARLFALRGSVSEGIHDLKQVTEAVSTDANYPFLKAETLFMLTFVTFNLSGAEADRVMAGKLIDLNHTMIQRSPLLVYAAAVFHMHYGENEIALDYLKKRPAGTAYYPFHYLDYLTGLAKLNRLDEDAGIWFLRYVNGYKGGSFIKSAYQRLGWIDLLRGDKESYHAYMFRIRHAGRALIDGDKQALAEAESSRPPDVRLLRARLLFDGGYYKQAGDLLAIMTPDDFSDPKDKLEFIYRRARIYHLKGQEPMAISTYRQVIDAGVAGPWYFAANSALNLGLIHEQKGDFSQAEYYFRKCLALKYSEYKSSISQKARAGLNRLDKK
jgi:tetratricopeptide (TPR) repeat protein